MASRKRSRRPAGAVRRLASGRWQARVRDPLSMQLVGIGTFKTKADADTAIANALTDQQQGRWVSPEGGRTMFGAYATRWLDERVGLRPRTVELYEGLLRLHLIPTLGNRAISDVSPSV